jgi:hypothetical protein
MSRFGALFSRPPRRDEAAVARVRDWVRAALSAGPETRFAVNEIVCADPACPGTETVVLVMEPGRRTRAIKVPKAIEDVTEADVREAVAA